MFIMRAPGHPTRFVDPPLAVPVDDTTVAVCQLAGVKTLTFLKVEADKIMAQITGELTD